MISSSSLNPPNSLTTSLKYAKFYFVVETVVYLPMRRSVNSMFALSNMLDMLFHLMAYQWTLQKSRLLKIGQLLSRFGKYNHFWVLQTFTAVSFETSQASQNPSLPLRKRRHHLSGHLIVNPHLMISRNTSYHHKSSLTNILIDKPPARLMHPTMPLQQFSHKLIPQPLF